LLDEALASAHTESTTWARNSSLTRVAESFALAGLTDEAMDVAQLVEQPSSARADLAVRVARAGDADTALHFAQTVEDGEQRAQAMSNVAVALAGAGLIDDALNVVRDMDDGTRAVTLSELIPNVADPRRSLLI